VRFLAVFALIAFAFYTRGYRVVFRIKEGVILSLSPEMAKALHLIETAHMRCDVGRGVFITSGREGDHMPGSLHYSGNAIDIRTRDLTSWQVSCLIFELRQRLGKNFDVVDETSGGAPHIHIEYDPD
jgi:hypothetical protein